MIRLEPVRLHWVRDDGCDDQGDLCAHSPVRFEIDNQVIVRPEDGDWTASASAIFLLRALNRDHTKASPVGDQIFPCCGHGIFDVGQAEVVICGCPSGINVEIRHAGGCYCIKTERGGEFKVPEQEWRAAVFGYSDQVMCFYKESLPKEPGDEVERKGFQAMMAEWRRLRTAPGKTEQAAGQDGKSAGVPTLSVSEPGDVKTSGTFSAEACLPMTGLDREQQPQFDFAGAKSKSAFTKITAKISLMLFGLLSCLVGFVSVFVSILLMISGSSAIDNIRARIFMAVWQFVICEILLAFGVTAFLLGLRYICGPKEWVSGIMNTFWKKAMKIALAMPVLVFGSAAVLKLIDWLLK